MEVFNYDYSKIDVAGQKMETVGNSIAGAGKKMMGVTTVIGGVGVAAVKTAADFDSAMSQVAAVSGATGKDFDALRNKAREMGAKTKFSATEAAEAMNYMAMAGWKTEDMLDGIEGVMNLAAASGEDLAAKVAFMTMLNKLIYGYRLVLIPYLKVLENSSGDEAIQRIQHLELLISQNSEQREALTKLMAQGYIDQILYNQETNALLLQAETYRSDIEAITIGMTGDAAKVTETNLLLTFCTLPPETVPNRVVVRPLILYPFPLNVPLNVGTR